MKPVVSERGRRILAKTFAVMRRYPETVDMSDWYQHEHPTAPPKGPRRPAPYCGTVACLAGHIALVATGRRPDTDGYYERLSLPKWLRDRAQVTYVPEVAVAALGVPVEDEGDVMEVLFYVDSWPVTFRRDWDRPGLTARQRAAVLIARVRHWLKTGK